MAYQIVRNIVSSYASAFKLLAYLCARSHNRFHNSLPILKWAAPPPEPAPLDELSFRRALDEFALAEMRFGK